MPEIVMPRLSDSMEEGTILSWLKQVGEEVALGEELVEIETDKANMAYEADVAGTLTEILAEEGQTLPIGAPIARIGDGADSDGEGPDEGRASSAAGPVAAGKGPGSSSAGPVADATPTVLGSQAASAPRGTPASAPPPAEEPSAPPAPAPQTGQRVKASPVARRLAKEQGVDLSRVEGSGPGGRIVKRDVEDAGAAGLATSTRQEEVARPAAGVPSAETAKGEVAVEELSKLQQVVARRMSESKATAPHFYLTAEVDMSACVEARKRLKAASAEGEVVPSFNDMVVKACAIALKERPKANGAYRDGKFELYSRVNVGVAVAAPGALVVPTVFDADRKGLKQIAEESRELAAKVREQTITPPELSGGTFTVSNLGMYGVEEFSAVINSGQAAILAVGAITEKAVVRDGEIVPAHLMRMTIACDHRILYGAEGAELLARVKALLQEPLGLAL